MWRIIGTTSDKVVTTIAGSREGYDNGAGTVANFYTPTGVAVDSSGNVYVADYHNSRIRKITSEGGVTTIAGTGSSCSANTGTDAEDNPVVATFNSPSGVAVDSSGNVYVVDNGNNRIRKIEYK